MGLGRGLDVTKTEWEVKRTTVADDKKGLKLDGTCRIRFITNKDNMAGGNLALFSTGEVGMWKVVKPDTTTNSNSIDNTSYDDAVKASSSCIEIEVPSTKRGDRSMLVYNFPMGTGSIQPLAVLVKTKGSVKYYPNGRSSPILSRSYEEYGDDANSNADGGMEVGIASMHLKGGKPLVDPSWAKGRRWFWTKREQAGMTNPGYI